MNCDIYRSSSQASSVKPDDTTTDLKNEEGKHQFLFHLATGGIVSLLQSRPVTPDVVCPYVAMLKEN